MFSNLKQSVKLVFIRTVLLANKDRLAAEIVQKLLILHHKTPAYVSVFPRHQHTLLFFTVHRIGALFSQPTLLYCKYFGHKRTMYMITNTD